MATLTTVYGAQATLRDQTVPAPALDFTLNGGKVRCMFESYTVGAADEFGTSGLIKAMKLPKGARVVDAHVVCPATGATGIFDIGWAAGAGAVEAADADGLFAGIDPGAAAVDAKMAGTVAGFFKKFEEEVQVEIDCTEATAAMAGLTIKLAVFYIVE